jgi:hypothetical protein
VEGQHSLADAVPRAAGEHVLVWASVLARACVRMSVFECVFMRVSCLCVCALPCIESAWVQLWVTRMLAYVCVRMHALMYTS